MLQTTVCKQVHFEAAHLVEGHPKCGRLHGHSYVVNIFARGPVSPHTGFVIDFADMKALAERVILTPCDHQYLNDLYPNMNGRTTAENLAALWLKELNTLNQTIFRVQVYETATAFAEVEIL